MTTMLRSDPEDRVTPPAEVGAGVRLVEQGGPSKRGENSCECRPDASAVRHRSRSSGRCANLGVSAHRTGRSRRGVAPTLPPSGRRRWRGWRFVPFAALSPVAPGGVEPPRADSKSAALSAELRGPRAIVEARLGALAPRFTPWRAPAAQPPPAALPGAPGSARLRRSPRRRGGARAPRARAR
jgi:hypothetical protein